jgi:hypothetical protein
MTPTPPYTSAPSHSHLRISRLRRPRNANPYDSPQQSRSSTTHNSVTPHFDAETNNDSDIEDEDVNIDGDGDNMDDEEEGEEDDEGYEEQVNEDGEEDDEEGGIEEGS